MSQSAYSTEDIRAKADAASRAADNIDQELNNLRGDMNALAETWRGLPADSMQKEFDNFDREASAMMQKLTRLSEALKTVAARTEITETELMRLFEW
jgi:WXG100 family type VII secretion target